MVSFYVQCPYYSMNNNVQRCDCVRDKQGLWMRSVTFSVRDLHQLRHYPIRTCHLRQRGSIIVCPRLLHPGCSGCCPHFIRCGNQPALIWSFFVSYRLRSRGSSTDRTFCSSLMAGSIIDQLESVLIGSHGLALYRVPPNYVQPVRHNASSTPATFLLQLSDQSRPALKGSILLSGLLVSIGLFSVTDSCEEIDSIKRFIASPLSLNLVTGNHIQFHLVNP